MEKRFLKWMYEVSNNVLKEATKIMKKLDSLFWVSDLSYNIKQLLFFINHIKDKLR